LLTQARAAQPANDTWVAEVLAAVGMHQLRQGRFADAEATLREALQMRIELAADPDPRSWSLRSAIGGALAGQGQADAAESMLVDAATRLFGDPSMPRVTDLDGEPDRARAAADRLVELYEDRHAADPKGGFDQRAEAWRARLAERALIANH
jgi:hypothetical protein